MLMHRKTYFEEIPTKPHPRYSYFVNSHSSLQNIVASKETSFTLNRVGKLELLSKTQFN